MNIINQNGKYYSEHQLVALFSRSPSFQRAEARLRILSQRGYVLKVGEQSTKFHQSLSPI